MKPLSTLRRLKTPLMAAVITLMLFLPAITVQAADVTIADGSTVAQIQTAIQNEITAANVGDTVTVYGTYTQASTQLTLAIPAGVTVVWDAAYSNSSNLAANHLISISGGGAFEIGENGVISRSGTGTGSALNVAAGISPVSVYGSVVLSSTGTGSGAALNIAGGTPSVMVYDGGSITRHSTGNGSGAALHAPGADASITIYEGGLIENTGNGTGITASGDLAVVTVNGSVSANTGSAIRLTGTDSTVTVDGDGVVENMSTTDAQSAIFIGSDNTLLNVIVKGNGRVQAHADGGYAIMTYGDVEIYDNAVVSATTGAAIDALGGNLGGVTRPSTVTIYGGTVSTTGGASGTQIGGSAISSMYVVINGGVVSAKTGKAILARTPSSSNIASVIINGGMVLAEDGYAIRTSFSTALIELNGGFVFAYGADLSEVVDRPLDNNSNVTITDGVVVAWDEALGHAAYDAQTSDDLSISDSATAVWGNQSGNGGIRFTNGANSGFFPLPVTVTDISPPPPPPPPPTRITAPIPTLNSAALVLLALVLGVAAFRRQRLLS